MNALPIRKIILGPLPDFNRAFKQWFSVMEKYCKVGSWDDVPWWYNERPLLSLFAAAVWNSGGIALEEYSISKSHKKERWSGRGDLYVKIKRKQYVIEAKQVWSPMGARAQKPNAKIEKALFDARHAAGETKSWGAKRLGLVFAVPYLPNSEQDNLKERINYWLECVKSIEGSSMAWIFSEEVSDWFQYKGYLYPGIVILLRPLRHLEKASAQCLLNT